MMYTSIGDHLPQVKDLTNAVFKKLWSVIWCQGAVGALPPSNGNYFQRQVGAIFFTEWGFMAGYPAGGFGWCNY